MTRKTGRWVLTADAEQRLSDRIVAEGAWRLPPGTRASRAYRAWERAQWELNPSGADVSGIAPSFNSGVDPVASGLGPHAYRDPKTNDEDSINRAIKRACREARVALREAWIAEGGRTRRAAP